ARDEFIERDRAVAGPQSARRSEIRNAAFGRYAGTGERHDRGRRGDHVAELFKAGAEIRCDHGRTICEAGRIDYSTPTCPLRWRRFRRHRHAASATTSLISPLFASLFFSTFFSTDFLVFAVGPTAGDFRTALPYCESFS